MGMQRASRGMEAAGDNIVRSGLQNANALEQRDNVDLSHRAQAFLRGESPPSIEESVIDFKKHQFAHKASAKVAKMESERFSAFSSIIARHGSS